MVVSFKYTTLLQKHDLHDKNHDLQCPDRTRHFERGRVQLLMCNGSWLKLKFFLILKLMPIQTNLLFYFSMPKFRYILIMTTCYRLNVAYRSSILKSALKLIGELSVLHKTSSISTNTEGFLQLFKTSRLVAVLSFQQMALQMVYENYSTKGGPVRPYIL